ncbi:MAG: quinone-dependent dihydroorotate dehydrogenase [Pseudomonadota bacterium]
MNILEKLGREALFSLEPERAHRIGIKALASGLLPKPSPVVRDGRLATTLAGLSFANPVGVAAGFDKDAEVPDALLDIGFGFTEVGTLTPKPQIGNPAPRVFRLVKEHGVINRLGFNNGGHAAALSRLKSVKTNGPIGVNIGANKDSEDRIADYVSGIERFYSVADYFTVNISSPNTPGLRDLQGQEQLRELLSRVYEARGKQIEAGAETVPIFLKIAPDVAEEDLPGIVEEVKAHGIEGMIVSNTTLSRATLERDPGEAGGLSGRPVFERSTIMLAKTRKLAGPDMAIIGVGGVEDTKTAVTKIKAGADAVQIYTGMIYGGPKIAERICSGLVEFMEQESLSSLTEIRDADVDEWAAKSLR